MYMYLLYKLSFINSSYIIVMVFRSVSDQQWCVICFICFVSLYMLKYFDTIEGTPTQIVLIKIFEKCQSKYTCTTFHMLYIQS